MIGLAPTGTDLESIFIRLVDRSDRKADGTKGAKREKIRR